MKKITLLTMFLASLFAHSQTDTKIYDIIAKVSSERIEKDITTLANFGTRHTLSDTVSNTRGIGAARRWITSEFETISKDCNDCLEVFYQKNLVKEGENRRITKDVWVVNVVAIQRGTKYPNRYIIMSGDIDSRISDPNNFTDDAPGANDNASGMAGTLEAARVLSQYEFENSIIYLGLSGEEQGLFGGKGFAEYAKQQQWELIGVFNNDMIGNIKGFKGVELAVIAQNKGDLGFMNKMKFGLAKALTGQQNALTIIGPATIVKEMKKDPKKLEVMMR